MKYFLLSILFIINLSACATAKETQSQPSTNNKFYAGQITKTELKTYDKFFKHHHFEVAKDDVELLATIDKEVIITTYFGLWCHDSKREVPRLLDLLEATGNKNIIHRMIALDIEKKEPFSRQDKDQVKYTPTMIVTIDGKEVGRIVEKPNKSLAQDIVSFLK